MNKKRILSFALAVAMIVSVLPTIVFEAKAKVFLCRIRE